MRIVILALLAATLAAATEWQPEVRLTDNDYSDFSYWSTQRRVVVDPAGRVHVAWHVMNSGLGTCRFQIYYKRWYPATGWTADTMLSADLYESNVYCKYPSLAVDSTGTVHAAWAGGTTDDADEVIYLKSCVPGGSGNGGWEETSRELSTSSPSVAKNCPTVTATPDGRVHAAWLEGNNTSVVHRERIDTTWQAPLTVEGGSNYKAYPAIAGGPDNRLHLSWYGREGTSGYYNVWYKARTGTTWGATENVSSGVRHQMYQSIAVNPATGNPHLLWQCYGAIDNKRRVVHRWRDAGGWQPTDTLSELADTLNQETGQLIFTIDGRGHAAWGGRSAQWPTLTQFRYSERSPAGNWSAPVNVTDTSGTRERPSIAAGAGDAPNDIHAVWTDYRDGTAEIYYACAAPGQWVAEKPPAQRALAAPAAIVRGTLFLASDPALPKPALVLLDASGRTVMALAPGPNDVSRLAPGVYFVRPAHGVARVVLLR
ncbi:MAG: hypothetical protein R6X12_00730 [bacterium]